MPTKKSFRALLAVILYALIGVTLASAVGAHTSPAHVLGLLTLGLGVVATVRDGTLPVGSFDITVLENPTVPFVFNNFSRTPASKKLVSMSARGVPSRQRNIAGQVAFTADCQVPDESTAGPRMNQSFAIDADRDGNVEPYQFDTDAGDAYTQDGEIKMKVSGMAMVTPLIYDGDTAQAFAPTALSHTALTAVTGTAATNLLTKTAHGLNPGDAVKFSGLTGGSGLTAGTPYYVIPIDANDFKVSLTRVNALSAAPTPVALTTDVSAATVTAQAGQTLAAYLPRDVTLGTFTATGLPTGVAISTAGLLSGAPSAAQTFAFTIKCTGTRTVSTGKGAVVETVTGTITGSWVIS